MEYDVKHRTPFHEFGKKGRFEAQTVMPEDRDEVHVRVCYYQKNGRFANRAPTVPKSAFDDFLDAVQREVEVARNPDMWSIESRELPEKLSKLIDEVGEDRAMELLAEQTDG
jgi:hypothetical protein